MTGNIPPEQIAYLRKHAACRSAVLSDLHTHGPRCARDIKISTGLTDHYIRVALTWLIEDGVVRSEKQIVPTETGDKWWNVYSLTETT